MKKKICLIILLTINFIINAQKKESDYFTFYKGGGKYLKPLKYVLFIPKEGNVKTEEGRKKIFKIGSERFVFDKDKHKVDTSSVRFLNNIKLEKTTKLRDNEVVFYKNEIKKTEIYKKSGFSYPFPITKVHPYFKIYLLEKTDMKLIKYEVDWEYSDF
ncbi:hypothetical protein [Flavobacterium sp. 140616W15]|uniref:hypothetical protein n=1 Tax=Flavobacterium sp. 140616W15 TaxID=2478552 RepID=UPI000F0C90D0|nr:hypothetical protein [Flavobacterium sp. 140616W15]AYN06109.1 hypothetical protein EAG11_19565 [Flavobacterium sp. 140616W15]